MCSPSTSAGNSFAALGGAGEVSNGPVTVGVAAGFGFAPFRPDCPKTVAIRNVESNNTSGVRRISTNRFRIIDLRALQSPAVIDINRLPFGKDVEHLRARFAV